MDAGLYESRAETVKVRVTAFEKEAWREVAGHRGMSEWVRGLANDASGVINIELSDAEYARWDSAARSRGVSLDELIVASLENALKERAMVTATAL